MGILPNEPTRTIIFFGKAKRIYLKTFGMRHIATSFQVSLYLVRKKLIFQTLSLLQFANERCFASLVTAFTLVSPSSMNFTKIRIRFAIAFQMICPLFVGRGDGSKGLSIEMKIHTLAITLSRSCITRPP